MGYHAAMSDLPLGILGLGLLFGLRHATEADHIAAVGAIVSERRGLLAAVRSGALWGAGHTLSILLAGLFVLGLDLAIPDRLARALELVVAVMIIALGGSALARALRSRPDVHSHVHVHDGTWHRHLHFHDGDDAHLPRGALIGLEPEAKHELDVGRLRRRHGGHRRILPPQMSLWSVRSSRTWRPVRVIGRGSNEGRVRPTT